MSRPKKKQPTPAAPVLEPWIGLTDNSILDGRERRRQRMEHYRSPLKIRNPEAPPEMITKWHGAPPRRLVVPKRTGGPIEL